MSWWPEQSRPREVKGGIKAQSKSGAFGKSWWAKQWIAVLESFDLGARLTRGRSYARSGQVLSIKIEPGRVLASVQGSQPKPYKVDIVVKTLSEQDWTKVAVALSEQAIFAAKLMAGEMPETIEETFRSARLTLFPSHLKDLQTKCSCPDASNPCKHIAAVYYLLGEEFDRDPFLIFRMRGISREHFLSLLSGHRDNQTAPGEAIPSPEPLAADPVSFWQGQKLPDDLFGEVSAPPVTAALLRRLGTLPFWQGEQPLIEALSPCYARASDAGLKVFVGEATVKE